MFRLLQFNKVARTCQIPWHRQSFLGDGANYNHALAAIDAAALPIVFYDGPHNNNREYFPTYHYANVQATHSRALCAMDQLYWPQRR
ncbi:hypothetical protein D3C86_690290 [compost metagenome]